MYNVYLLQALAKKLEGDVAIAKANIRTYAERSVGIGEHPEIVQSIEAEVSKAAEAQDKLNMVNELLNDSSGFLQE
jgi:hypothetical protein